MQSPNFAIVPRFSVLFNLFVEFECCMIDKLPPLKDILLMLKIVMFIF